jgi:hypothetical protein
MSRPMQVFGRDSGTPGTEIAPDATLVGAHPRTV